MKANYATALVVEQIISKMMFRMEQTGWPVDLERLEEVRWNANENMEALEDYLVPNIRMTPTDGKWKEVEQPFLKSGKVGAAGKYVMSPLEVFNPVTKKMQPYGKDYLDTDTEIVGPFCKVKWHLINLGSDSQVKKYLFELGWKPTEWNINKKTGTVTSPKLTEDSFWSLKSDIGQQVAQYLKLKHRRSMCDGLSKIVWYDEFNEPRISQVISGMTPTFRCTHKGIVNVPGEDAIFGLAMRSIFRAPVNRGKKYVMLGVDAKSCQLRMLCHYMRDPLYTEAVLHGKKDDGTDIHSVNMKLTEGLLTSRTQAKRFIYGLLFGAGDPKLGAILGGTKADGTRLRKVFMERLTSLADLLQALKDVKKKQGYIVGLDGRKVYVRSDHQLLVYLVQSAEAILMRWALALLYKWEFFDKFDIELVGFIHDETQFIVAEEQAELAAQWVCAAFEHASAYLKLTVPAEGDPAIGPNWASTH